ncbi:MAG: long-chain fatty acid--CoA ligase [Prolixibacteraceae bacterium]|nr:long-chain fatty acid--CoA ligase [Prolixibacteraceae bacterium]
MEPSRIFDILERNLKMFPNADVLAEKIDGKWKKYTIEEYNNYARWFALGLLEMGFLKNDKIATITNNRPEWNFVDLGMTMIGVVHVPVYTSLNADEYRYVFDHSDARMVIVSDRKFYEKIRPVCDQVDNVEHVFTFSKTDISKHWLEVVEKGKNCQPETIDKLEKIKKEITPSDPAALIYTSGTTGTSKGVMLSHKNLVSNFMAAANVFKMDSTDRYLNILPLCHVGGRMGNYQTQYVGACIYYAENMGTIAANLKEIKATGFDAVPRILEKVFDNVMAKGRALKGMKKKIFFWAVKLGLRYEPFGANGLLYGLKLKLADKLIFSKWREALGGCVRLVGCGGASLQPRLERIFWAAGIKILNMYGLTETSPIITINRQEKGQCKLGTVGTLIDGVEVKIAGNGEILTRGENLMIGYYKDETLTKEVIDEDGWFHTGDVGNWVDGKFLSITDRIKEIFKLSNGKYVAPQPLENKLKESSFIDQVMVLGEHQKFTSALLLPDFKYLKEWYYQQGFPNGHSNAAIVNLPQVKKVFSDEIARLNKTLSEAERIMRFRIIADEWSPDTGELSASLKLKRKVIESKYKTLLDQIYRR